MLGSRKPLYLTQIVALNATWIFLFDCSFIPQYITVTKDTIKYTPAFIDRRVIDRSALWLDISGFLEFFVNSLPAASSSHELSNKDLNFFKLKQDIVSIWEFCIFFGFCGQDPE